MGRVAEYTGLSFRGRDPGGNVNVGVFRVHMILNTMRLASPRE